jgi:hypothetical protein
VFGTPLSVWYQKYIKVDRFLSWDWIEMKNTRSSTNTVVSNHFDSGKILLFSSARSRDFDGIFSIRLPLSMYTTKTPIDLCRLILVFGTPLSVWYQKYIKVDRFLSWCWQQQIKKENKLYFKEVIVSALKSLIQIK